MSSMRLTSVRSPASCKLHRSPSAQASAVFSEQVLECRIIQHRFNQPPPATESVGKNGNDRTHEREHAGNSALTRATHA